MRIAVTGSIASDHLMHFPGKFSEQLLPDQLHRISLSFLVDDLKIHRGGVGANIAYGLAQLGLNPVLVGAVGTDFADYDEWLSTNGVDTAHVHRSVDQFSPRFVCTTDNDQNQIASFYPGAMTEAGQITLAPIAAKTGAFDYVLIGANDPVAMESHTRECRENGTPFVADPSQQLAFMSGEQIKNLINGAAFLFTNEYEKHLLEQTSGLTSDEVLAQVGTRVTTLGDKGTLIERAGEPSIEVGVAQVRGIVEPTGVGDALRAGFFAGQSWGLSLELSAQVGALLAAHVLETMGTQEYRIEPTQFLERLAESFGDAAAAEVKPHIVH